ncbi:cocosin 1-like [Magnolia sinica]|uniref:cocosin 1-like n=1 Tax=Magnolia sinica TaxID=86752 RepID=UPI00265A1581|nr:cocosin 1-like [Magnolia sinica]
MHPMAALISLALCFLVLFHGSVAQFGPGPLQPQQQQQQQQQRFRSQSECRVQSLSALEPNRRYESEAGVTEHWDQNNEQLECAGVAATRHTIAPRGLLLPSFDNAPRLIYVVQGRGITGAIIPGCPESFQSFQQSEQREGGQGQRQRQRDQHQKIQHFRQGDIIAIPAGVAHWTYNDGETPVVLVSVLDTSNYANQLDQNHRRFRLAGSEQQPSTQSYQREQTREQGPSDNIFNGFNVETLAEAFGVSRETARKLQSQDDNRGSIVQVENGLQVVRPPRREEDEEQEQFRLNGLEEIQCSARLRHNIAEPTRADVYNPQAGRITSLNSQKFPILNVLQLSAERGVLYRNALLAPHWNVNAHSVVYATRGNGRVQIVGEQGRPVFDGELREGQLVVVPQSFAVVKKAGNEGFEYVAFKTNDNAMNSPLVGKTSVIRAMPEDVLMNSYRISREEARRLKYNREEIAVFSPRFPSQQRAAA